MVKRPVDVVDSSEESEPTSSSHQAKRARANTNGDSHANGNGNGTDRKNGNGRAKPAVDQASDAEDDDGEGEEADEGQEEGGGRGKRAELTPEQLQQLKEDEAFEKEFGAKIQEAVLSRRRRQGGIADMGIIQSLELVNFMCHKNLSFNFGPQINFIIGHNGSGKSAVLTALTVALGGKATATNRANSLKTLIKEGEQGAEVTVVLKNKGPDAYNPETYGDSISITRRFTLEGSTTYKIKGALSDKTISTKREELNAICDHMNIQVDNPMNVLAQDTARQFLSASKPKDKYAFFLRGTQLLQLSMEYELIRENIKRTGQVVSQKEQIIPELNKEADEARNRYQEAQKARDQQERLENLKQEQAWSLVFSKEKEVEKEKQKVETAERVLPKLSEAWEVAQANFEKASADLVELEGQIHEEQEMTTPLEERRKVNVAAQKERRQEMLQIANDEKEMNTKKRTVDRTIAELQQQLEEETRKLEEDTRERHAELQGRLTAAKHTLSECRKAVGEHAQRHQDIGERLKTAKDQLANAQREREEIQTSITASQNSINHVRRTKTDGMQGYGQNIPQLLERIKRENWFGETPLGPFGMYVDAKQNAGPFVPILKVVIGNTMRGFVLTDARDRPRLKRLLEETNNRDSPVFISGRDLFDYSHAEPAPELLTLLRVLHFKDEWVLRIFINAHRIEQALLCQTRVQAAAIFREHHMAGVAYCSDGLQYRKYGDGGEQATPLEKVPQHPNPRASLFLLGNPEERLREAEEKLRADEQRFHGVTQQIQALNRDIHKYENDRKNMQQIGVDLESAVRAAQNDVESVEFDMRQDEPANLDSIEQAKRDSELERDNIISQFTALQERKARINHDMQPLLEEQEQLKTQLRGHEERIAKLKGDVEKAAENRLKAQSDKAHYEKKLQAENEKVTGLREKLELLQQTLTEWTADVSAIYDRPDQARKTEVIEREIEGLKKALADRAKRDGASVEDMARELTRAQSAVEQAKKDVSGMKKLQKILRESLYTRQEKWHAFRRHISMRAKTQFQYHLDKRNYYGRLDLNHIAMTLELKVQTGDAAGTQRREKDPKSLSGGEKSFSTICLLLSLWEAISCPIRCLDEFDVFMDAVNRSLSMKLLTGTAKDSAGTQYILITPQDMTAVHLGPEVRVHRMNDPERGQARLNFH